MNAVTAVLNICSWFFNPSRWKARRKEKQVEDLRKWENALAKALKENDVRSITIARANLRSLREKYKIAGVEK